MESALTQAPTLAAKMEHAYLMNGYCERSLIFRLPSSYAVTNKQGQHITKPWEFYLDLKLLFSKHLRKSASFLNLGNMMSIYE